MALRFFNTYSREIEEFEPRHPSARPIRMYTCGPTVYSRAHIGNFRAYIFEDLLQRHLELRGYKVHRVMNITDVEDKTIRGAREAGVPLQKFTEQGRAFLCRKIGAAVETWFAPLTMTVECGRLQQQIILAPQSQLPSPRCLHCGRSRRGLR